MRNKLLTNDLTYWSLTYRLLPSSMITSRMHLNVQNKLILNILTWEKETSDADDKVEVWTIEDSAHETSQSEQYQEWDQELDTKIIVDTETHSLRVEPLQHCLNFWSEQCDVMTEPTLLSTPLQHSFSILAHCRQEKSKIFILILGRRAENLHKQYLPGLLKLELPTFCQNFKRK